MHWPEKGRVSALAARVAPPIVAAQQLETALQVVPRWQMVAEELRRADVEAERAAPQLGLHALGPLELSCNFHKHGLI